jgi:hypothetical protein
VRTPVPVTSYSRRRGRPSEAATPASSHLLASSPAASSDDLLGQLDAVEAGVHAAAQCHAGIEDEIRC